MLPGFRSLFVAVVLAVSMLIFGLGAAALLRATHEEFASLPLKQTPEVTFGSKETEPALAVLQVDTPAAEPATPESSQAEAQNTETASPDAQPESEAGAPATDASSAPADSGAPAAFPPPSGSVPAMADTTPPANAAAPEPSGPAPSGEAPIEAGEAVTPPSETATPPVAKSDTSSTDGKTSDVGETMTSPFGEHFKPPLPGHRPAKAAQAADPTLSAAKRSSAKEPRAARRHRHRRTTRPHIVERGGLQTEDRSN